MNDRKNFSILTLGCKVNQYESESIIELFQNRGYRLSEKDQESDIYIINTCTVTNLSDRKSRQYIRKAKRENPKAIIAVIGCYSQIKPDEVSEIPGVDIILGTNDKSDIVNICESYSQSSGQINRVETFDKRVDFETMEISNQESMTRAYMKVQDGCNQYCSYCIIPYARGPIRSRDLSSAVEEAKRLAKTGYREVILTGIHIGSYGLDLKEDLELIDLIEAIAGVDGIDRIRLSSIEPNIINQNFMERLVKTEKVCDHFHLSLQSGSDSTLRNMNRKYSTDTYKEKTNIIRDYMPAAGLTTDIIVGFPGESDENFRESLEFSREVEFSKIHVFKYSPREGTPAASKTNQVQGEIKINRSNELLALSDELADKFIDEHMGSVVEVLFEEEVAPNRYQGYSTNYIRVEVNCVKDLKNSINRVKILNRRDEIALGEVIS